MVVEKATGGEKEGRGLRVDEVWLCFVLAFVFVSILLCRFSAAPYVASSRSLHLLCRVLPSFRRSFRGEAENRRDKFGKRRRVRRGRSQDRRVPGVSGECAREERACFEVHEKKTKQVWCRVVPLLRCGRIACESPSINESHFHIKCCLDCTLLGTGAISPPAAVAT